MMCNEIVIDGRVKTWKLNVKHFASQTVPTHAKSEVWNENGFS